MCKSSKIKSNNFQHTSNLVTPPNIKYKTFYPPVVSVADSGSTDIIVRESDKAILQDIVPCTVHSTLQVSLPNGDAIQSSAIGSLRTLVGVKIPAFVFPDAVLKQTLLSLSAFCNNGCTVTLTNTAITIQYKGNIVFNGTKAPTAKLWTIDLCPPDLTPDRQRARKSRKLDAIASNGQANLAIKNETDAEFVAFIHGVFGFPTSSGFLKALNNGNLSEVPRITAKMVTANLPNAIPTAKGHLDQTRQGQRSTKQKAPSSVPPLSSNTAYSHDVIDEENPDVDYDSNEAHVRIIDLHNPEIIHADGTGRMPYISRKGNQYVLVSYYKGYIHYEPMSSRTAEQQKLAHERTIKFFRDKGHNPVYIRLDNEISETVTQFFQDLVPPIQLQLVPPNIHRANKAERSIRDAKNHLIAILCGVASDFPIKLWDECLPQAEITLNHLRNYTANPKFSAYEGIYKSKYNFKAHPLAVAGTKVVIHDKPAVRGSWAAHGLDGFYLGPALGHYRCWRVWCTSTESERITDTIAWFPAPIKMPGSSSSERLTAAITDLSTALQFLALSPNSTEYKHAATATAALNELVHMYQPTDNSASPDSLPQIISTPALPPVSSIPPLDQRVALDTLSPVLSSPPTQQIFAPALSVRMTRSQLKADNTVQTARIDEATRQQELLHGYALTALTKNARSRKTSTPKTRPKVARWIKARQQQLLHGHAFAALNLTEDSRPLTLSTAKAGPEVAHWIKAEEEEWDRLFNTGTAIPRNPNEQPPDRRKDTTYYNPQVKEKLNEAGQKTFRVRGTVGGDRIKYPGEVTARTAELESVKVLLNSVVSTPGAQWMTIDIKDYYLGTPMDRSEWMRVPIKFLPEATVIKHKLHKFIHNGFMLCEIAKGMYGLPQAGILAQKQLLTRLAVAGYIQDELVPCVINHKNNGITFTLVVDDFGIKFTNSEGAEHLISTLEQHYEIKVNRTGSKYLGMKIAIDYDKRICSMSIPGYIAKVIIQFRPLLDAAMSKYKLKSTTQAASPSIYSPPTFGNKGPQFSIIDTSDTLDAPTVTLIQGIIGAILFYALAVEPTVITAVCDLASEQARPTAQLLTKVDRLLSYVTSYPNNELIFQASDMNYKMESDGSYLSRASSQSVAGGFGHFGMNDPESTFVNGPIYNISKVLDVIVASAGECEYGSLFKNLQNGSWTRLICKSMGHPQTTTEVRCDNQCAVGIANDTCKLKRSKSFDMRYHWIRDRIRQGQFSVVWKAGATNLADFFTKALPVHEHQKRMKQLVHIPIASETHFQSRRARTGNEWRIKKANRVQ